MHPVSQLKLFIAHAAVGILAVAAPASAATVFAGSDTTINFNVTGDAGPTGAPDSSGVLGGAGVEWTATLVDVIIDAGVKINGGAGGDGGADASNDGGNFGGIGGSALEIGWDAGTASANGATLTGGLGGAGSNGGAGGASDTPGGIAGHGGVGVHLGANDNQITLTNTTAKGGAGGGGGAAGNAVGDATNTAKGGFGAIGGAGIFIGKDLVGSAANAVINLVNTTVTGGDGGEGGVSLAGATNASGGHGGAGIYVKTSNANITIDATSIVSGGNGGGAGGGGSGGNPGNHGAGILLSDGGSSVTNYGTILGGSGSSGGSALELHGDMGSIDNFGSIGAAANHAAAAVFFVEGALSTLHNRPGALIQSTGNGATIVVLNAGTVANFTNEGSIINSGAGGALQLFGSIANFSNSGLMSGGFAPALSISGSIASNVIDNSGGVITNDSFFNGAVRLNEDLGADGIKFDGGEIVNNGTAPGIQVTGSQSGGISLSNITVTSLGAAVRFEADDETLNVTASDLNGKIVFAGGSNTINFANPGVTYMDSEVETDGTVAMNVTDGAGVSATSQTVTHLNVGQGSTLGVNYNHDFNVVLDAVNDGEIGFADTGHLTVNTLSGAGNYKCLFGSYCGGVTATGAGSSLDFAGATFEIEIYFGATPPASGDLIKIAEDANGNSISGVTDGAQITDDSALLDFFLYRGDAPEIGLTDNLLFFRTQALLLADIAGEGDDPNSIALGGALDAIGLDGDADLDDLMLALAQLPTNGDINDVLDALLPETDGVAYDLATDAGDQMLDVASRRLDGLRGSAGASLEYRVASLSVIGLRGTAAPVARSQLWGQAFGRTVDQSKHSYNDGYDAGSYGFAVGADTALDNATQLGAAFSYTSTDADGNGINRTDTDVESYQLTLYGDHLFDNRMYAKGLLAYGWHQNDIARHDVGGIPGNTATGGYDASQINLRAELGRAYAGGGNLSLIPRATLNAARYSPDGYSEQGVGGLGLTVLPDDLTSVRLGLGLLARWNIEFTGGELLQPELRLDYRRDLTQERFETTSEFLGAPGIAFVTQGAKPPADILNLGVGALLATAAGVDLRASYDLELKEDYTAHAGYIRASIPF